MFQIKITLILVIFFQLLNAIKELIKTMMNNLKV